MVYQMECNNLNVDIHVHLCLGTTCDAKHGT